jgi:hypothetical protein
MRIAKVSRAGLALLLGCVLTMVALVVPGLQANAADGNGNICQGLDSGKIDVSGDKLSVTVTAPTGYLIDEYCVKAGSAVSGTGGPVYVAVNPPQKSVTITYPSGKAISHYSVSYVAVTPPPSTTTTKPPPSTPPTSSTTKHTSPPSTTTTSHASPSSSTTSSAAPVSTATTYPLQPVNAGATSDNAVAPSATNRVTVIGLALLVLLALFGGRRLLQMRLDRPGSRRE